jgi:hypothetical protein
MQAFEIAVDHWLAREHGDEVARATLGQLELRTQGYALTRLEDRLARSNRTFANLSAYELAVWLATNWWRLRWEPEKDGADWRMAHSIAAIGGGYVWPDVTISSDGEQIQIRVRPTRGTEWEPIRYLESSDLGLAATDVEDAIDSFIEKVLARLDGCRISGTGLHTLWQDVRAERADPEIASIRKLEALLGFDAGSAADEIIDELLSDATKDGHAAVEEVAAGYGPDATTIIREVTDGLEQAAVLPYLAVRDLAAQRADWSMLKLPWERAAQAARVARALWHLDGAPVPDQRLAELVGAKADLIEGPPSAQVKMSAAKWTRNDHEEWRLVLRSRWPAGRRFELCRLIAAGLIAPEGELLLPATTARTSRQKFQRAFAQEFLCPFESLMERLRTSPPEDEDIEDAAAYFQVSPLLIRTTLVNKNILPREQLPELPPAATDLWR